MILRVAKEQEYNLIAIGSRGLRGTKAWLMGLVLNKVVSESDILVLVAN